MSICPFCKAELTEAALQSRRCSACHRELPPEKAGGPPEKEGVGRTLEAGTPREAPPEEEEAGAAGKPEMVRTLQSETPSERPPSEAGAGTADEKDIAETLNGTVSDERPPAEADEGTADEKRIAETLNGSVPGERPPLEESEGTTDGKGTAVTLPSGSPPGPPVAEPPRPAAEDSALEETYDSGMPPVIMGAEASASWAALLEEASPKASIKKDIHTVVEESKLILQSRKVRGKDEEATAKADYELMDLLGEGGMGIVYSARQASLDRVVALKMLKPDKATDERQSKAFMSEAVVTGDLEHPNIVPIYDLGIRDKSALFYSMKRVKGTPWSKELPQKLLNENLEILMRAADAIAFAHSREVIHRDLKPENIMLGDYGEVLLMDWGLAMSLSKREGSGMGGTPAYMAPEMATGPVELLGVRSDVYLLGAILFEILTGKAPHPGKNAQQGLYAASRNEIQATDQTGELIDIARKAMATAPKDRYESIRAFQGAIREYQSHSESNLLATRAEEDLGQAERSDDYQVYARALFGFQEARELWGGNERAVAGESKASLAYAASALRKSDYDLGASLLDPANPDHADLHKQLKAAAKERDTRERRLKTAKWTAALLVLGILATVTIGLIIAVHLKGVADDKRAEAVKARENEEVARIAAEESEKKAVDAQKEEEKARIAAEKAEAAALTAQQKEEKARIAAEKAEAAAVTAQQEEEKARIAAEEAQQQEEYGAYVARIGAIAANIDENAFERARELLTECPEKLRSWEWNRLEYLSTQAFQEFDAGEPIENLAFSPDGKRFATGGWGPVVQVWDVADNQKPLLAIDTGAEYVFAMAFSPEGKSLAIGTNGRPDYVKIWDAETGQAVQTLRGRAGAAEHTDAVVSVQFSGDGGHLLSSSYDGKAILWELATGESREYLGHYDTVWSAAFSPDETRFVTASQDGQVLVWSVETGKAGPPFLGHVGPVYSAKFSPDGHQVVSAGYDKQILIWDPDGIREFNYASLRNGLDTPPPQYRTLTGHTAAVRSVQFSADGQLLLSTGNDNTVRIWDAATGELLKTLRGHGGRVTSCALSPDGRLTLSGGYDHKAKLWRLEDNKKALVFGGRVFQGHRDDVLGASFSRDGTRVVTAGRDRTAMIWNLDGDGEPLVLREGHEFLASSAVFFPGGEKVLTAAVDSTVRIWDVATGAQLLTIEGTGPSAAVALSHDGSWLLTGSDDRAEERDEDDRTARIWDTAAGELRLTLGGHRSEVAAVAVSPDDKFAFTGDTIGNCRLFDAATGDEIWHAKKHMRSVTAAAFLPDGSRVLTASLDGTVATWDVLQWDTVATGATTQNVGRELKTVKFPRAVTSMALSPDGQQALVVYIGEVISGEFDPALGREIDRPISSVASLLDVESGEVIRDLAVGREIVGQVAFSPDGRYAVTTDIREPEQVPDGESRGGAHSENLVRLWDLSSGEEIGRQNGRGGPFLDYKDVGDSAWSAIFSPSGMQVLTVGGYEARLWDLRGAEIMEFSPHEPVASASFSPDGRRVATTGWDGTVKIWDAQTGRSLLRLLSEDEGDINSVVFSPPEGNMVLTAGDDGKARLWDLASRKKVAEFVGHERRVNSAAFSADGQWIVTASDDKTARIWNARTAQQVHVLEGHGQSVLAAAFSPDGTRVITGSEDNSARLWDAQSGEELLTLAGHTSAVTSVAFSPRGERVITGSQDYTGKVWELKTGKEVLTLRGHSEEVTAAAFSPDGATALTASRDGTLVLWPTSGP